MIYENAPEFLEMLPKMQPIIGLDLGTKTIGVALSDRLWHVATADQVLKRKKFGVDAAALLAIVNEFEVGGIVLGLPKNMDGTEGPRVQSTRSFARNLDNIWGANSYPILLWDERLSTVAAERAMLEADLSRKKRSEKIDAVAAAIILQGALDRMGVLLNG